MRKRITLKGSPATTEKAEKENISDVPEEWKDWQKYGHSLIRDSVTKQDDTAKYLIALVSTIITLYTTLLTFFGLSGQITMLNVLPLVVILLALGCLLFVFSPEKKTLDLSDPVLISRNVAARGVTKGNFIKVGVVLLCFGIFLIPVCIILPDSLQNPEHAQLIVADEMKPVLENCSIAFVNNSTVTQPLTITHQDSQTYSILFANGDTLELNKTWVRGILINKT
jgi:hypothetical protein